MTRRDWIPGRTGRSDVLARALRQEIDAWRSQGEDSLPGRIRSAGLGPALRLAGERRSEHGNGKFGEGA